MTETTPWPKVFVEERNGHRYITSSRMLGNVRVYRLQVWKLPSDGHGTMVHLPRQDAYWTNDAANHHATADEAIAAHTTIA